MVEAGRNDDDSCTRRNVHRLEVAATRRHFRLVFPEVYPSGVSRQEELSSNSRARYVLADSLFRTPYRSFAAEIRRFLRDILHPLRGGVKRQQSATEVHGWHNVVPRWHPCAAEWHHGAELRHLRAGQKHPCVA